MLGHSSDLNQMAHMSRLKIGFTSFPKILD